MQNNLLIKTVSVNEEIMICGYMHKNTFGSTNLYENNNNNHNFERSIDMIHPSYSELIEAINTNNEDDDESMVLNSRYSLILATSKRARQLIGGAKPLADNVKGKKPLSIAIDELYNGKVKILPGKHEEEDLAEIAGHTAEKVAVEENTAAVSTESEESAE